MQVVYEKWYEDGHSQTGEPTLAELVVETISEYMGEMRQYCVYPVYQLLFVIFWIILFLRILELAMKISCMAMGKD